MNEDYTNKKLQCNLKWNLMLNKTEEIGRK